MNDPQVKRSPWMMLVLVAGLLGGGIYLLRQRSAGTQQPPAPASAGPANPAPVTAAPVAAVTKPAAEISATAVKVVPRAGGEGAEGQYRIKTGEVLATVNGQPVELKHLLPLPPGTENKEVELSADRYHFLLERAVDREITFQAAKAQGVEIAEWQREQLAKLRARSEAPVPGVFDDLQANPANVEFEAWDATGLLLQANLAEKAGVPARDVMPEQVEEYFQKHQGEYGGPLPTDPAQRAEAWEKIDQEIRVKLANEVQAQHDQGSAQYLEKLRASAVVIKTKPAS